MDNELEKNENTFNESINKYIEKMKQEEQDDPSMVKIRKISNEAYQRAANVAYGKEVEKYDYKEKSDALNELLKNVTEKNKAEAKKLVSEALLDVMFVNNPKSLITSLRIGHIVESIKRKNVEKENKRIEISSDFLPVGTVVLLKDATKRLMITGFCIVENENQEKVWNYSGCLYPEGYMDVGKNYLFDNDQIEEVLHLGLIDEEEIAFKNELNKIVNEE